MASTHAPQPWLHAKVASLKSALQVRERPIEEGHRLLNEERQHHLDERRRREYAEWQLKKLQAQLFGSKSEPERSGDRLASAARRASVASQKMDPEQLQFLLDGFEAATVLDEPGQDATLIVKETKAKKPSKRLFFPEDLPERKRTCPKSGAERRFIRWEESIKINFVPGHFKRLVIRRAVRAVPFAAQRGGWRSGATSAFVLQRAD